MTIRIGGWDDNIDFSSAASGVINYTKNLFLPPYVGSVLTYENTSPFNDVEKPDSIAYLNNFRCEILIDGAFSTDITSNNPVIFELAFS